MNLNKNGLKNALYSIKFLLTMTVTFFINIVFYARLETTIHIYNANIRVGDNDGDDSTNVDEVCRKIKHFFSNKLILSVRPFVNIKVCLI